MVSLGENIPKLSKEFPSLQSGQRQSLPEEISQPDRTEESSGLRAQQRDQPLALRGVHQPPASHINLATGL